MSSMVERLRAQRVRHLERPWIVRFGFVIGGFALLAAGVAMIVLPGPGVVVIAVALAILSLEFAWAGRLLEKTLVHAEKAREGARQTSRTQRIVMAVVIAVLVAAGVEAAVLWDIPLLPV
jgi:uncharacterized protein (TIGR02611 family)